MEAGGDSAFCGDRAHGAGDRHAPGTLALSGGRDTPHLGLRDAGGLDCRCSTCGCWACRAAYRCAGWPATCCRGHWGRCWSSCRPGLLMFMAHAADLVGNRAFVVKLSLIFAAGINAAVFHAGAVSHGRAVGQRRGDAGGGEAARRRCRLSYGWASSHADDCWHTSDSAAGLRARLPRLRGADRLRPLPAVLRVPGPVPAVPAAAHRVHRADGGVPGRGGARAGPHGRPDLWRAAGR